MGFLKKVVVLAIVLLVVWLVFFKGENPLAGSGFDGLKKTESKFLTGNAITPSTETELANFESALQEFKKTNSDSTVDEWIGIKLKEAEVSRNFFAAQNYIRMIGFENRSCDEGNPLGMAIKNLNGAKSKSAETLNAISAFEKNHPLVEIELVKNHKETMQNLQNSAQMTIEELQAYC